MTRRQYIYWLLLSLLFSLPLTLWSDLPLRAVLLLSPLLAFISLAGFLFGQKPGRAKQSTSASESFLQNQNIDLDNLPSCPHCGGTDVAKMIYGKPALTRQLLEGLESGKLISGGCMVHAGAPEWHCNRCRRDFGHHTLDLSTTTGEAPH